MINKILVPVFRQSIIVFVGDEEVQSFIDTVKKAIIPDFEFMSNGKDGICVDRYMWLREKDVETVVHESFHMAQSILDDIGIPYSGWVGECWDCGVPKEKHGEAMAYLIGYLAGSILETEYDQRCDKISRVQCYECQEIIKGKNKTIGVDKCLKYEIQNLIDQEIHTIGSCCGCHIDSIGGAYIQVELGERGKMKKLGYIETSRKGIFNVNTKIQKN